MQTFTPIMIACVFHVLDILSGFISAVRLKDIKSSRMRDGLFKKLGFIFCYILAWLIDNEGYLVGINLGTSVLTIVVLYTVTTEIVSILENISEINPDLLPEKLMELFEVTSIGKDGDGNAKH